MVRFCDSGKDCNFQAFRDSGKEHFEILAMRGIKKKVNLEGVSTLCIELHWGNCIVRVRGSSVPCYPSSQRVRCSLSLRNELNEFNNRVCVYMFIRPTCLTLSLNRKFEATSTHDIHWISVFSNQGVHHGKHRHRPFQKSAQIFVGLQSVSRVSQFNPRVGIHATCMFKVLCILAEVELIC